MSSSASEICPRSILRYRPLDANTIPRISPWMHQTRLDGAQAIQQTQHTRTWSSFFSAHSSGFLAAIVGLGMCFILLLILVGQLFAGWAQITLDDWRYGRPRTFQVDVFVGQEQAGQPSHFVAINNRGQVEVIELFGNDPARAHLFLGPHLTGMNADLTPITLRFLDPHHTHRPDLVVQCGSTSVLFLNRQGTFQLDGQR